MTRNEWKRRCAARYMERGGLNPQEAADAAEACFNAQDGEFFESAGYSPESCADDDMDNWSNDAGGE